MAIAGMMELAPAAVEVSTPRATAPADEKNAALVAEAAGAVEEEKERLRWLRMTELPPGSSSRSPHDVTAPAVDEKNAALVAQAAEKVAKEEPLYLEKDDKEWRRNDGTAFESALQVDPEHGVSPVKAHRHALYHRAGRAGRHDGPPAGPPKGGVYRPRHTQEA